MIFFEVNPILIFFWTVNCVSVIVVVCLFQLRHEFPKSILKNVLRQLKIELFLKKLFSGTLPEMISVSILSLTLNMNTNERKVCLSLCCRQNDFQIHNRSFGCSKTVLWLCNSITGTAYECNVFLITGIPGNWATFGKSLLDALRFRSFFSSLIRSLVRSSARLLCLCCRFLNAPRSVAACFGFGSVRLRRNSSVVSCERSANQLNRLAMRTHFSFWTHSVQIYQRICADYRTHTIRTHSRRQSGSHSRTHEHTHKGEHSERNRKSHQVPHQTETLTHTHIRQTKQSVTTSNNNNKYE